MLENVPAIETYTLVDSWRNLPNWNKPSNKSNVEFDEIRSEALSRVAAFEDKIVELRHTTKEAAALIDDKSLDLAYVDGDHTLRGITIDLLSLSPKIKAGGFICGDDFTKTIWQHRNKFDPTLVFPFAIHFAEAYDLKIYTLPFDQFLIVNDPTGFSVKDYGSHGQLTPQEIYAPPPNLPGFVRRLGRLFPARFRIGAKRMMMGLR